MYESTTSLGLSKDLSRVYRAPGLVLCQASSGWWGCHNSNGRWKQNQTQWAYSEMGVSDRRGQVQEQSELQEQGSLGVLLDPKVRGRMAGEGTPKRWTGANIC